MLYRRRARWKGACYRAVTLLSTVLIWRADVCDGKVLRCGCGAGDRHQQLHP
jgi:hypothetical protein